MSRRARAAGVLLLLAAVGVSACSTLRVDAVRNTDDGEAWPTEGRSVERRHAAPVTLDPPLEVIWEYDADGGFGAASPLLNDGWVLVATRHGEVHGIDLSSGDGRGHTEFGDAIEGTPVLDGRLLYVPVGWGGRALQAYDLVRGKRRWSAGGAPIEAGLLLHGGRVFAADVEGGVRAFEAADGALAWEWAAPDPASFRAAPVMSPAGHVVVADDGGEVTALEASGGQVAWRRMLAGPVLVTPAALDDRLFVATTRGRLFALDARTGHVLWSHAAPDTTVRLTSPAADAGLVIVGGSDGVLRALDAATGEVRWRHRVDDAIAAPPLLTRNTVFAGTMKGRLLGVDRATGREVWVEELEGRVKSPMAVRSGHLVVLAEPRLVYLFSHAQDEYAVIP